MELTPQQAVPARAGLSSVPDERLCLCRRICTRTSVWVKELVCALPVVPHLAPACRFLIGFDLASDDNLCVYECVLKRPLSHKLESCKRGGCSGTSIVLQELARVQERYRGAMRWSRKLIRAMQLVISCTFLSAGSMPPCSKSLKQNKRVISQSRGTIKAKST